MNSQAAHASFVQCVCSASQRPNALARDERACRAIRGRKATTAAAAIPAAATTTKPARVVQWLDPAAATDAIGVSAALSSMPSTSRLSPSVPMLAFVPGIALHDRDADRVVDPAGERDAADASGAAGEGECVGRRPFARLEEPLPAPRLEGVGGEKEESRGGDEQRIGVVDRPAGAHEVPRR